MNPEPDNKLNVEDTMRSMGVVARAAQQSLSAADNARRNSALLAAAAAIREQHARILDANAEDLRAAEARDMSPAMLDRLRLDAERIETIAVGLEAIAELPDPLGRVLDERTRPNGLRIERISVPLGVIGIIFESRPNVTADAGALCIKSGNPAILRGGSESMRSNVAIHACLAHGLRTAGIDSNAVQLVPIRDRAAVGYMLSSMAKWIDVVVPRGGRNLVKRVQDEARVPVIGHLEGLCHVYVHSAADPDMAIAIAVNAKMRRTGICGAAETLLLDRALDDNVISRIIAALRDAGCEVRGDQALVALCPNVAAATDEDWTTEYLDAVIAVRIVDGVDGAIEHIRHFGSSHTESIVTTDQVAADRFLTQVDSAIVLHNASTQFADGGEFGMGAEIGIATGRVHARGPVGTEQLCSYKYIVRGTGQTRP